MNWGKGIIIGMASFMTFIIVLISIIMSNRIDLVSEDYYQKEISYSDEIAAKNEWSKTEKDINFQSNDDYVIVHLPSIENVKSYHLSLIRPDDNKQDLDFDIEGTNTFLIEKSKLEKGVYEYKLSCKQNGKALMNVGKHYVK